MKISTMMKGFAATLFLSGIAFTANAQTWTDLDLSNLSSSPVTVESITSEGQVMYKIQPTEDGILSVTQVNSQDPHIFTDEDCYNAVIDPAFQPGLAQANNTFNTTYALGAGTTYYFKAKLNEYDDIKGVSFTNFEVDNTVPPVLNLGEKYTIEADMTNSGQGTVYQYSPTADGTLVLYVSASMQGGQFLFTNKYHSNVVNPYASLTDDDGTDGWYFIYKYPVEAGVDYYLYAEIDWITTWSFMAEYSDEVFSPGVTVIPNDSDPFDWGLYTDVLLDGTAELAAESVTFAYGDQTETLLSYADDYSDDHNDWAYQISGPMNNRLQIRLQNGLLAKAQAANATEFTITITGLTCGGVFLGDNGKYTLTYTIPAAVTLLEAESTIPDTFYVYWSPSNKNGVITLVYDQPLASVGNVQAITGNFTPGGIATNQVGFDLPAKINPDNNKEVLITMGGMNFQQLLDDYNNANRNDDAEWKDQTFQSKMSIVVNDVKTADGLTYSQGGYAIWYKAINFTSSPYPGDEIPDNMTIMATANPAENDEASPYSSLSQITLTWGAYSVSVFDGQDLYANVALGNNAPVQVPGEISDGALVLDLSSVLDDVEYTGIVTVSLPALLVQNEDGDVNQAQSFVYYVNITNEVELNNNYITTIESNDDDEPVSVIFTWVGASEITLVNGVEGVYAKTAAGVNTALPAEISGGSLVVSLATLADGNYTVVVPEAYVNVTTSEGTLMNAEAVCQVGIGSTAITSLEAEAANGGVYNLNGVKVGNSLEGLAKGIYIINGKKVLVK